MGYHCLLCTTHERTPIHVYIAMRSKVRFIFVCMFMEKMNESDNMGRGDIKTIDLDGQVIHALSGTFMVPQLWSLSIS